VEPGEADDITSSVSPATAQSRTALVGLDQRPTLLDMWVIFWIVDARVVRVSGSGGGARYVAAAVFAACC